MRIDLFLSTSKHLVKKQYVIYDGNSFFADVGGYLGLILGHSLLGIYQNGLTWTLNKSCSSKK